MVILCVFREADPRNVANGPISTCRNSPSAAIIATRNFHIAQISRQTEPSRWPEVRRKLKRFFSCVKSAATTTTRSSESLAERNFALKSIARVCGSTLFMVKRRSKSINIWLCGAVLRERSADYLDTAQQQVAVRCCVFHGISLSIFGRSF